MTEKPRPPDEETEPLPLSKAAEDVLQECRIVLPGLQALIGFQFIAVFQPSFEQKLSPPEQQLHLLALGFGVLAAAILMTPAAYHRQTGPHEVTAGFLTVASRLLMAGLPLLAVSVCVDFYLIARLVLGEGAGTALGVAAFSAFVGLWFVLPRVQLLRRALGDRCPPEPDRPEAPKPARTPRPARRRQP